MILPTVPVMNAGLRSERIGNTQILKISTVEGIEVRIVTHRMSKCYISGPPK